MSTTRPGRDAGRYRAAHLHQPDGWLSPGYLEIDTAGSIVAIHADQPPTWDLAEVRRLDGFVLPGMANLHSHAHQRGLAGKGEGGTGAPGGENFWTWRTQMYAFVERLSPDDLEVIAAQAYVEMLKAGFTTVGEFHYLHHDQNGQPYANHAELSERILSAADASGIALTLLPVLYTRGGIGKPPAHEQRRFVHGDVESFARLVEHLLRCSADRPLWRVGIAPHSVRAVTGDDLNALSSITDCDPSMPVHIHVAEQTGEVDECEALLGMRPIDWLLAHVEVDDRWTLIHATHGSPEELDAVAASGATVGLCPITEANLGDGVFPLSDYHQRGGRWGIGTDSNVAISLLEELRLLVYGQRLLHRCRDTLPATGQETAGGPGRLLFDHALVGGARSLGQPIGAIRPGRRADLIELDPDAAPLLGHRPDTVLDGWIFGSSVPVVRNVMVGGAWAVRDGHHIREREVLEQFRAVVSRL
ncbi:MAG: formimidoylglutamate deiminase [Chloroflexota bacterium]|nr:formimidoylglutamate deiminase [Chloroflexota bacterium]